MKRPGSSRHRASHLNENPSVRDSRYDSPNLTLFELSLADPLGG